MMSRGDAKGSAPEPEKISARWAAEVTWRNIAGSENDGDESQREQANAIEHVTTELGRILSSECLVVLCGLGASLGIPPVGDRRAPTMADFWNLVKDTDEFKEVREHLTQSVIETENLEYLLSDAQARLSLEPENSEMKAFVDKAEGIVLEACSFVSDSTDVSLHEGFLRKIARRSPRLQRTQVFTTNYDLAFEQAAANIKFHVIDGFGFGSAQSFDGSAFDLDYVRRKPNSEVSLEPNVFHLLKLHGSVDWNRSSGTGEVVRVASKQPERPVLIYPSESKFQLSYQQPYIEVMARLQMVLRQPDVSLVIIGFGFNDDHVVAPIKSAIRSNVGLRVVVADPALTEDGVTRFDWLKDLVDEGDRRILLVGSTFSGFSQILPEGPAFDERELHHQRIVQSGLSLNLP